MRARIDSNKAARLCRMAFGTFVATGLLLGIGCATISETNGALELALGEELHAAVALYEASEFEGAAEAFRRAERHARDMAMYPVACEAVVGQCTSWLRARQAGNFASCADRLESLGGRWCAGEPEINTLIGLGAIAGGRPLPELRLPDEVAPILRDAAQGGSQ